MSDSLLQPQLSRRAVHRQW